MHHHDSAVLTQMPQEFYFLGLGLRRFIRCNVLEEKILPGEGRKQYLLALQTPIPKTRIYSIGSDQSGIITKLLFLPHGSPQPYPQMGPFWGSVDCFQDETKAEVNSLDTSGTIDRALLCVSEKQAQKWVQILEDLKNHIYSFDFGDGTPHRECRIIKEFRLDNLWTYWLAEFKPPFPCALYKKNQDISKVILRLQDFPIPPDDIGVWVCLFDEKIPIADSMTSDELKLAYVDEGGLTPLKAGRDGGVV